MSRQIAQQEAAQPSDVWGEPVEPEVVPWTAQQAAAWRQKHPTLSPWRVLAWQLGVTVVLAVLTALLSRRLDWAGSLAYGGGAVVLPAAVFARGLLRPLGSAGAALASFFVWELVKVVLTVVLLLAAPKLVPGLNWLALVAGFVVAMKVYWLAMWFRPTRSTSAENF